MTAEVRCDYCRQPAKLVDAAQVYFGRYAGKLLWRCDPCDAHVGVHDGTRKPLGRLANKELREWKMRAHAVFDPLWQSGTVSRSEAYMILALRLRMPREAAHIGMFDVEQCKAVVAAFKPAGAAPAIAAASIPAPVGKNHKGGKAIVGKQYRVLACRETCPTLPWDVCPGCHEQAQWLREVACSTAA